jgi:hypothetical protein
VLRFAETRGQAAVELVAVLPLLAGLLVALLQFALVGYGVWSAGNAARAGARAALVDGRPERAALSALPEWLEAGADVEAGTDSAAGSPVRVAVDVPTLIPGLPAVGVHAAAALGPSAGG